MYSKRLYTAMGTGVVITVCTVICISYIVKRQCAQPVPLVTANQTRSREILSIPLINKNKDLLNQVCTSLIHGNYRSLERCERDCTDVMMRRAEIINSVYSDVCSQTNLDKAIEQSSGHQYQYMVNTSVNGRMWDYYTNKRTPAQGNTIDWVENIDLVHSADNRLSENIVSVSFMAHKVGRAGAKRDTYSVEIYASDMEVYELELAVFDENGEMVAYVRFKRNVGQYILLLNKMTIQDKLCVTF